MTTQQRYTGPELSALLREVRSELGDLATIHEANRIRTGGIGGFFRREGFEVLASPPPTGDRSNGVTERPTTKRRMGLGRTISPSPSPTSAGHLALSDSIAADDELIAKLTEAMASEQAWVDAIGAASSPPPPTIEKRPARRFGPEDLAPIDHEPDRISPATMLLDHAEPLRRSADQPALGRAMTPGQAILDRAESISAHERVGQLLDGARGLIDDSTITQRTRPLNNPVPPRGLLDSSAASGRLPGLLHRVEQPIPQPLEQPIEQPRATPMGRSDTAQTKATGSIDNTQDEFWDDLAQLERVLPIRPTTHASVQLLVGPLDVALPLATRFANDPTIELSILCDEVELEGVRSEQLADSSRDLHQRLVERSQDNSRAIGVIEADDGIRQPGESLGRMLTPRLLKLINRVSADGAVDLVRLTLRSLGPVDEMQALVNSFSVPCAIDLGTAPTSTELAAALDAQLPIVSVAGRQLTPALAMALKHR